MSRFLPSGLAVGVAVLVAVFLASAPLGKGEVAEAAGPAASVNVVASAPVIGCGYSSTMFATVRDAGGVPVNEGTVVTFQTTFGAITSASTTSGGLAIGVLFTQSGFAGTATVTATAGGVSGQANVQVICGGCTTFDPLCSNFGCGYNFNCANQCAFNIGCGTLCDPTGVCANGVVCGAVVACVAVCGFNVSCTNGVCGDIGCNVFQCGFNTACGGFGCNFGNLGCGGVCGFSGNCGGVICGVNASCGGLICGVNANCGTLACGVNVNCGTVICNTGINCALGSTPVAAPNLSFGSYPTATSCGSIIDLSLSVRDAYGFSVPNGTVVTASTTLGTVTASTTTFGGAALLSLSIPPKQSGSAVITANANGGTATKTMTVTCG